MLLWVGSCSFSFTPSDAVHLGDLSIALSLGVSDTNLEPDSGSFSTDHRLELRLVTTIILPDSCFVIASGFTTKRSRISDMTISSSRSAIVKTNCNGETVRREG